MRTRAPAAACVFNACVCIRMNFSPLSPSLSIYIYIYLSIHLSLFHCQVELSRLTFSGIQVSGVPSHRDRERRAVYGKSGFSIFQYEYPYIIVLFLIHFRTRVMPFTLVSIIFITANKLILMNLKYQTLSCFLKSGKIQIPFRFSVLII